MNEPTITTDTPKPAPASGSLPTPFELRVLRRIKHESIISGDGLVAISAAARRLERKGYARKGSRWYLTSAGHAVLTQAENAELSAPKAADE